jgi:periplasmic protein TonB
METAKWKRRRAALETAWRPEARWRCLSIRARIVFRAAAVPLPAESGGEAMRYRFIVGGMLERVKHYPERALQRAKGVATVGFVLDRSGGVASVVLLRSSGEADLDAESVALVNRAAPFPPPPPGAQHSFAIEVSFGMRT